MIWRRLLVRSDSTIEDLHYLIQLAMGWENLHLHHFLIRGKQYGITDPGGMTFSDQASEISLASFGLREKENLQHLHQACHHQVHNGKFSELQKA